MAMNFTASEGEPNSHPRLSPIDLSTASDEKLEKGQAGLPLEETTTDFQDRIDSAKAIKPLGGWRLTAVSAA